MNANEKDATYPDRHDRRSQLGKSSPCILAEHGACKVADCACPCHDAQDARVCPQCGHAKGLHDGPEGVCVADCRSLDPLAQCGCAESFK